MVVTRDVQTTNAADYISVRHEVEKSGNAWDVQARHKLLAVGLGL